MIKNVHSRVGPRRYRCTLCCVLIVASVLWGCTVKPNPFTREQHESRLQADWIKIFTGQTPPVQPITLAHALTRAIRYNLEQRVKIMEAALAQGLADMSTYERLPNLAAAAGYTERDRQTTATQDLFQTTAALSATWNVLDFGISYIRSKQEADRVLVARERRRRAGQILMQEVRGAFRKAYLAQQLKSIMDPLQDKVEQALVSAREAEIKLFQPPVQVLGFQKTLLRSMNQIQQIWWDLSSARVRLAGLININPNQTFLLAAPETVAIALFNDLPDMEEMVLFALRNRPELYEKGYQHRISQYEVRKAILRFFPGLEFQTGYQYDSSGSFINHAWAESGLRLVWNLVNLLSAPKNLMMAHDQEELEEIRRLALHMTIMTQTNVAFQRLVNGREKYATALKMSGVNDRLFEHSKAAQEAASMNEQDLLRAETDKVVSGARRDLAMAELQNAAGTFLLTLGFDILPRETESLYFLELENLIKRRSNVLPAPLIPGMVSITPGITGRGRLEELEEFSVPETEERSSDPDLDTPPWTIQTGPGDPDLDTPPWAIQTGPGDPDLDTPPWAIQTGPGDPELDTPSWVIQTGPGDP